MSSIFHSVLQLPVAYRVFQEQLGFANSRKLAFERWLPIAPGTRILDIGCGPGHILKYLPQDIDYTGFDTSESYIDQASKEYGLRAKFVCGMFDASAVAEHGTADVIMLNGVLHHMSDEIAGATLGSIKQALAPAGRLFTLDGCYVDQQNWVAKNLLHLDRGEYVRTEEAYARLLEPYFEKIDVHIADDLSKIPYTYIVMIATS